MNNQSDNLLQNINEKELPVLDDKYILVKKVGSGATCKVKLALAKETNKMVAVKILNSTGGKSLNPNDKHYQAEISMLKKVNHQNIINLLDGSKGVIKKPDGRTKMVDYIVLEYAAHGELFDYLYFPREGLGEKLGLYIFKQLIEGLEACHQSGVAHRDLKTENLMMNQDWVVKIADFGYATLLAGKSGNGLLSTFLGTLSYACPEILNKKPYIGSCADIFSCGVILFVLVTGKLPFGKAVVFDSYYKNFIRNDYESFWTVMAPKIGSVSDEFKSLINLLLAYDSTQRPTTIEIKNHPFMMKDLPSITEVNDEFNRRKKIVTHMKQLEAEEEKKKKQKGRQGGVYRADDDNADVELFANEVKCNDYLPIKSTPYKVMIKNGKSTKEILNELAKYFEQFDTRSKELKASEEIAKFKVCYEGDQELAQMLPEIEVENLVLQVELKKVEDESYIVEFSKISGDKFEFFTIFDEYVAFNTKEQSEDEI